MCLFSNDKIDLLKEEQKHSNILFIIHFLIDDLSKYFINDDLRDRNNNN